MDHIDYRLGDDLDLDAVIDVYKDSTLSLIRPVGDRARMAQMFARADIVVSAWDGSRLVGIARSLSDFCCATYLSDLAVRHAYQQRGIGRQLIRRTREAGGRASVILIATPEAANYYPRVGFSPESGWILREGDVLR